MSELQQMNESSVDCFIPNLIDHYKERPSELIEMCLAYFAAWYEYSKNRRQSSTSNNANNINGDE